MSEEQEKPITKDSVQYEEKPSLRKKVRLYWDDLVVLWAVIKYSFTGNGRNPLK